MCELTQELSHLSKTIPFIQEIWTNCSLTPYYTPNGGRDNVRQTTLT